MLNLVPLGTQYLTRWFLCRFLWFRSGFFAEQVAADKGADVANKGFLAERPVGAFMAPQPLAEGRHVVAPKVLSPGAHPPGRHFGRPVGLGQAVPSGRDDGSDARGLPAADSRKRGQEPFFRHGSIPGGTAF